MCIAIFTTSHPQYPFILISNRDEYISRPTHVAAYWPSPHSSVLGGWDLERSAHGTWLGVTTAGKICCLTNYHETDKRVDPSAKSRGIIVNSWLKSEGGADETPEQFAARLLAADDFKGVGGFILTYGYLQDVAKSAKPGENGTIAESLGEKRPSGLPVLSNRATIGATLPHVARGPGDTTAVSNAPFGDRSWQKIRDGEALLDEAVKASAEKNEKEGELIQRLLGVLNNDNIPEWDGKEPWGQYCRRMEGSIFVRRLMLQGSPAAAKADDTTKSPATEASEGKQTAEANGHGGSRTDSYDVQSGSDLNGSTHGGYGTQTQTVILVSQEGKVTYFERTLYDEDERLLEAGKGDRQFEFQIESW